MTAPPVVSITDELVAELEAACKEHPQGFMIETGEVLTLLAERAELKRDAERYRFLRSENTSPAFLSSREDKGHIFNEHMVCEKKMDEAIDAAMQK